MLSVILLFVISVTISFYEIPSLLKKNFKKEAYVFSILMLIGVILGTLYSFNINIPNPLEGLSTIYKPITKLISKYI